MIHFGKPAPDLAPYIEKFWSVTNEGKEGKRRFFEILPEGNINLILRVSSEGCRLTLHGARTVKASVELDTSADYYCINFLPGQAVRLIDINPANLVDSVVDFSCIGREHVDTLAERLHSLGDPISRQQLLEALVRRSMAPLVPDWRCRQAAAFVNARGGQVLVRELAREFSLSVRTIERLFLENFGVSPKQHIRLVRFRRLCAAIRQGGFANQADLACLCGYTDQSHMIRDFKDLTGRLPGDPGACDIRQIQGEPLNGIVHRYRI